MKPKKHPEKTLKTSTVKELLAELQARTTYDDDDIENQMFLKTPKEKSVDISKIIPKNLIKKVYLEDLINQDLYNEYHILNEVEKTISIENDLEFNVRLYITQNLEYFVDSVESYSYTGDSSFMKFLLMDFAYTDKFSQIINELSQVRKVLNEMTELHRKVHNTLDEISKKNNIDKNDIYEYLDSCV